MSPGCCGYVVAAVVVAGVEFVANVVGGYVVVVAAVGCVADYVVSDADTVLVERAQEFVADEALRMCL